MSLYPSRYNPLTIPNDVWYYILGAVGGEDFRNKYFQCREAEKAIDFKTIIGLEDCEQAIFKQFKDGELVLFNLQKNGFEYRQERYYIVYLLVEFIRLGQNMKWQKFERRYKIKRHTASKIYNQYITKAESHAKIHGLVSGVCKELIETSARKLIKDLKIEVNGIEGQ